MGFKLGGLGSKEKNTGSTFRMNSPLKVMFPGSVGEGENMKSPMMKREKGEKSKVGKFLDKVGEKAKDVKTKVAGYKKADGTKSSKRPDDYSVDTSKVNKGSTDQGYGNWRTTGEGMNEIERVRAARKAERKERKAAHLKAKAKGDKTAKGARMRTRAERKEKNAKHIRKHGRIGHKLRVGDYEKMEWEGAGTKATSKSSSSSTKKSGSDEYRRDSKGGIVKVGRPKVHKTASAITPKKGKRRLATNKAAASTTKIKKVAAKPKVRTTTKKVSTPKKKTGGSKTFQPYKKFEIKRRSSRKARTSRR